MRNVVCFGEALIDFLSVRTEVIDGLSLSDLRQYPGGAPANVAVAIAKLGGMAGFMGQVGNDQFGEFLISSLQSYGVNTEQTLTSSEAKTPLAFVLLDENGERSFSFYREATADLALNVSQIEQHWFHSIDIFHFCSNTLTVPQANRVTHYVIDQALKAGALVSFDVNLRHNLWDSGLVDKTLVNQIISKAEIVKFSLEELEFLSGGQSAHYVNRLITNNASLVVVTNGGEAIEYFSPSHSGTIQVIDLEVKDTNAGGDAFVGGLLYQLSTKRDFKSIFIDPDELEKLIYFSMCCGAIAVSREGTYPSLPTLDDVHEFGCEV